MILEESEEMGKGQVPDARGPSRSQTLRTMGSGWKIFSKSHKI